MAMEPEMIRTLKEFEVPSSAFNILSNAGFITSDSLLDSNDMLLRSYGIKKDTRLKILSWIYAHKCVFNISLFSNNFQVGKPIPFKSTIEFCRWAPHVNKVIGQAEHFELIEVLMLLKEANQNVREMARQLNIPMKKMKLLIRHTPIPIGGDLDGFPNEESWHDQLPGYTSHNGPDVTGVTRASNRPTTPDLSNSTVSSGASFGSRSATTPTSTRGGGGGDGILSPSRKKQTGFTNNSANNSLNGSVPGGGGGSLLDGENESTNADSKKKTTAMRHHEPQPEWPVARYAFKTSSRTPAVVLRDKLQVQRRPSTSPASISSIHSSRLKFNDYNDHTYASVYANEVINSKQSDSSMLPQVKSSLLTVVVRKPPSVLETKVTPQTMKSSSPQVLNMEKNDIINKNESTQIPTLNDGWRESSTYMTTRNNLGTTFSPISSYKTQGSMNQRSSLITQRMLGTDDNVRPATVHSGFRARNPLRDPNTTYRSGGKIAAGNGMLSHTAATKFRPVYW